MQKGEIHPISDGKDVLVEEVREGMCRLNTDTARTDDDGLPEDQQLRRDA